MSNENALAGHQVRLYLDDATLGTDSYIGETSDMTLPGSTTENLSASFQQVKGLPRTRYFPGAVGITEGTMTVKAETQNANLSKIKAAQVSGTRHTLYAHADLSEMTPQGANVTHPLTIRFDKVFFTNYTPVAPIGDAFTVEIGYQPDTPNDPQTWYIPDQSVGSTPVTLELNEYFAGWTDLTYTAASSDATAATAVVSAGDTLTITKVGSAGDTTNVTVTATDADNYETAFQFLVTVLA